MTTLKSFKYLLLFGYVEHSEKGTFCALCMRDSLLVERFEGLSGRVSPWGHNPACRETIASKVACPFRLPSWWTADQ